jgi:hypothetical protein
LEPELADAIVSGKDQLMSRPELAKLFRVAVATVEPMWASRRRIRSIMLPDGNRRYIRSTVHPARIRQQGAAND